jgi:hypothetical protein
LFDGVPNARSISIGLSVFTLNSPGDPPDSLNDNRLVFGLSLDRPLAAA